VLRTIAPADGVTEDEALRLMAILVAPDGRRRPKFPRVTGAR
jgi:hypothetical protein